MLMVDRDEATISDIDLGLTLGAGHPMGPLQLADYMGLDCLLNHLQTWTKNYPHEHAFVIPQCLVDKVQAGHFGRKTGEGFYLWEGDQISQMEHNFTSNDEDEKDGKA